MVSGPSGQASDNHGLPHHELLRYCHVVFRSFVVFYARQATARRVEPASGMSCPRPTRAGTGAPPSSFPRARVGGLGTALRMQENLDGAAFVHGPVTIGGLVEGQVEVENLARVDEPVGDPVDQVGQLDVVGDADVADVAHRDGWSGSPASSIPGCRRPR